MKQYPDVGDAVQVGADNNSHVDTVDTCKTIHLHALSVFIFALYFSEPEREYIYTTILTRDSLLATGCHLFTKE